MNISIRQGNVLDELRKIPENSVDCIVTSPPYYGLRNYGASNVIWDEIPDCKDHVWGDSIPRQHEGGGNEGVPEEWQRPSRESHTGGDSGSFCKKCNAWKGELGQEPSYKMFINHLLQIGKELHRVLKPTGTMFWNMSDSYSGSGGWNWQTGIENKESGGLNWRNSREGAYPDKPPSKDDDIPKKSQMMIPERFAMGMIDQQGWIKRNTLVWYKRNGMPSSANDRFTNKWEPIFFFTKDQNYWFDLDSIRKPLSEATIQRIMQPNIENQFQTGKVADFYSKLPTKDAKNILTSMSNKQKREYFDKMQQKQKYEDRSGYGGKHSGYVHEDGSVWMNENGANPGDVMSVKPYAVQERSKEFVKYRNLPDLKELADYLNRARKRSGFTIEQIEEEMESQSPHHWFNAESYPTVEDWEKIKILLNLDGEYDQEMTEVFVKSAEKQDNPMGSNPGDVVPYASKDEDGKEASNEYHTNLFLKQTREQAKIDALELFPDDPQAQRDYIKFVHDHATTNGANPGDIIKEPAVRSKSRASNAGHEFTHVRKYDPDADGGDFLEITTRSHPFAHFAVYPETLVEPLIKSGCAKEVCSKCGKPKMPFREKTGRTYNSHTGIEMEPLDPENERKIAEINGVSESSVFRTETIQETRTLWKPSCKCNREFVSGTVLDPFGGSGTTALVAKKLGRSAILIELVPEYVEIMKKRLEMEEDMEANFQEVTSVSELEEDE